MGKTFTAKLTAIRRLQNTPDGNPRYEVSFGDLGTYATWPDGSVNFDISLGSEGRTFYVTMERGLVRKVEEVRERSESCLPVVTEEPAHGSIVLVHSCTGTAFQRLFATGRWHSTTSGSVVTFNWGELLKMNPHQGPFLLHDAATHEDHS